MGAMSRWTKKLSLLLGRGRFRSELDEEMDFHRAQTAKELIASGMTPEAARSAAARSFGNTVRLKEQSHEVIGFAMETVAHDIRYAVRQLWGNPGFTIVMLLTLALSVGANSAIFSVIDGVLLKGLPYPQPDRLMRVFLSNSSYPKFPLNPFDFRDFRARNHSFETMAAFTRGDVQLSGAGEPERLNGFGVTSGYFRVLGLQPAIGREFDFAAEIPGNGHQVILSDRLWRTRFGADRGIVGSKITLNTEPFTVIGVMPAGTVHPGNEYHSVAYGEDVDVWWPFSFGGDSNQRGSHYIEGIGRLRSNVSPDQARAEMNAIMTQLGREHPNNDTGWKVLVIPLYREIVGASRRMLLVLLGAVGMVLLITCSNVAGLLLTRALSRSREMAVRVALGAPQGRLVRQLLTEYFLLALLGATAGLGVGAALIKIAPSIVPPNLLSTAVPIEPNPRVILFTLALSLLAGLLFGLAPALAGARQDVLGALRGGRSASSGTATQRVRRGLVVFQVAVALVLLATSALMSQSLSNMMRVDPGFVPQNTLATPMILPAARFDGPHAVSFQQDLMERVRSMPGVVDVTMGTDLPLYDVVKEIPFDREDTAPRSQAERPGVNYVAASPSYFHTLQIAKRAGREFSETDQESAPAVVLVNQAFVERYFPGQNPLGKRLILNRPVLGRKSFAADVRAEIVGVVNNVRLGPLTPEAQPTMYGPLAQNEWSERLWLTVRHAGNAGLVVPELRQAVSQMDSEQSIGQVTQLETRFSNQFSEHKFQMLLMACFAALATLLAIIGIYGVNSHSVTQRRGEIGLRMALGASPGAVMREVMGSGARLTGVGLALGIAGALAASAVLRTFLVGISATDPLTLGAAAALLLLISAIATYFPARRAMQVNPSSALRGE